MWNGTITGDAGPYDQEDLKLMYSLFIASTSIATGNMSGVLHSELYPGNLEAPSPGGGVSPVIVNEGVAVVDGTAYYNTADISVAIPNPAAATRYDYIVLRKDWVLQTIRVTRIAGAEGAGLPALTQTDGDKWDFPLVSFSIAVGGALGNYVDRRTFLNRIVHNRQGGLPAGSGWASGAAPLADAIPENCIMQVGAWQWTGADVSGSTAITFPVSFSHSPIVIVSWVDDDRGVLGYCGAGSVLANSMSLNWAGPDATNYSDVTLHWVAIGPIA